MLAFTQTALSITVLPWQSLVLELPGSSAQRSHAAIVALPEPNSKGFSLSLVSKVPSAGKHKPFCCYSIG